jgi:hypothetical protein
MSAGPKRQHLLEVIQSYWRVARRYFNKVEMNAAHDTSLWKVQRALPNVVSACAKARDGFEAELNEAKEFFGWSRVATFDTFARFTRRHFRWGDAVSFLHAEYQDGPDVGAYVPDNGHLDYEVWGITRDRQYTVVASVSVSHPKLAQWPNARTVKSIEALKRDRDYKVIEKCPPQEFEPSLTGFDQLVDSLQIRFSDHSN